AVLGPTFFGNLFVAANTLPNLVFELVIGSVVVSLLVPPLVAHLDRDDPVAARRIACGALGVAVVVFAGLGAVVIALGPLVLRLLGLGISDADVVADQIRVGWLLLALVVPQALLYGIIGISSAAQNAHGRFFLPTAAPIAENLGTIAVFLAFALRWGTTLDLDAVGTDQVLFLGLGATAAVALHAAIQWWGAMRVGLVLVPTSGWRDPEVRVMVRLASASFGYAGLNTARYLVALVAAGSIGGGAVAYQLALNFRDLPNAVSSRPLALASQPELSRLAGGGDWPAFGELYRRSVRWAVFLLAPAQAALVALALPISHVVTFGGMDSATGHTLLVAALATMPLGIVADGVFVLATSASYAHRDAAAPFRAMAVRAALTAVGVGLALAFDGPAVIVTLGLSIAVADAVAGVVLGRLPARVDGRRVLGRPLAVLVGCAAVAGAAGAGLVALLWGQLDQSRPLLVTVTGLGATVVLAVYLAAALALRNPEAVDLVRRLPVRRSARARGPRAPRVAVVRHCRDYELDVRREAEALVAAGARCEVLYLGRRGSPWVETVDGVTLRRVPGMKSRGGSARYLVEYGSFVVAAGTLLGVLHLRHRYQAVQANTMPDLVVYAALVPKLTGVPVVAFMQEPVPELAESLGAGPRTVRLLASAEQRALRFADRTVTVTGALRQRYVERGADPQRIHVVHNGPDPAHLRLPAHTSRRAGERDRLTILCHGTIEERYGHLTLIDALAIAAEEVPGLHLVVTGRGSQTEAMLARVAEQRVGDRFDFEGWVSEARLAELLRLADVGVVAQLSSPYSELVHTNKMYDYWIAGLPVIASRLASTAADFGDDTIAYFDPGDPADLARQLIRLARSPEIRAELARAGQRAYARVGWAVERQHYLAVYRDLLPDLIPAGSRAGR
ncbi:MAG: glycosyltransferase, partial [Acidimicrobiia bacterium]|nr:glycosyltransferase [Acidimicrobiia bacterium]